MKKRLRLTLIIMMVLSLALVACQKDQKKEETQSDLAYHALHLGDSLYIITKAPDQAKDMVGTPLMINIEQAPDLGVGDVIALNFEVVMTSFPGQVNVEAVEKLGGEIQTYKAGFNLATDLFQIRPDKVLLVDVRTPEEFQGGHVPGSVNISVDEIDRLEQAIPDKDAVILVYCRSGNRSATAAQALKDMGYKVIFDLGGISDYEGDLETGSGQ